ncbi:DMT family transporter [Cognatishimia activa]|uniref:DMT family transporter n=1 Tax=Cognatishimia activa TaxID=1715691 RepID=UPI002231BEF1|nr:DMT family transporter [Cognatishimia activa]UZD91863.1 DMT family transporter [Cognatishimia activa]
MQTQTLASLTLVGATSVWGLYWVPLYYLEAQGMHGMMAMVSLNLAPAIVMLIAAFGFGPKQPNAMRALYVGVIAGLGFGLYSAGIVYGSVVRATLLFYLTPIWSTLISIIVLSERVTWRRWLAIGIGLSGVALLVGTSEQNGFNLGDAFALASGFAWAVAAVLIKRSPELPLRAMTGAQFLTITLLGIGIAAVMGVEWPSLSLITRSLPIASAVSLLVFIPSAFAIFWAQKHVFPGRAGLLMMSEVLVAVISASIFLPEERLGLVQWIGAVMIVGTFFIETVSLPAAKRRQAP